MSKLLKWLIKSQPRNFKLKPSEHGFTLIELMVAITIATLVIGSLLGFVVNVINNDRQEQAKAITEQEIQLALDYISQDLEQAVYIYDNDALTRNSTSDPNTSGIQDQIPPLAEAPGCGSSTPTCVPILVFWKREPRPGIVPVNSSINKDDIFVYSLVAYYLIKDSSNNTWSNTARIGRFQIRGGVVDPNNPTNRDGTANYITDTDPNKDGTPSNGYQAFDLTLPGSSLKNKMNLWKKQTTGGNGNYTDQVATLIDFVDQSATTTQFPPISCPVNMQQIPATPVGGFVACVDSAKTTAQVYIRGNALARLQNNAATYSSNSSTYFPTASIQIKGRGFLGTN